MPQPHPIPMAVDGDGNRYRLFSPASETGTGNSQPELWMRTEPPDPPRERLWTPTLVSRLGRAVLKDGDIYYDRMVPLIW